ncbi:MAG TPA: glycosyltransferase family 4 protein [Longimicrobium sp.]
MSGAGRLRALFVNSGLLGHATLARLMPEALAADPGIEAVHVLLSDPLSTPERVVRRLLCAGPPGGTALAAALLARFRRELHIGLLAARRIAALERRGERFDVLHFHTQAAAWASVRRMRRTPAIVSLDATQALAAREAAGALGRLDHAPGAARDRAVFRAAAAIVATSRWAADDLARGLPEAAGRVHVLHFPVRLAGFDPGWARERARRAGGGPVRVLFMGGDFPRKGGWELLQAWRRGGLAASARLTLATDWRLDEGALPEGVAVRRGVAAYTPAWYALWREADLFAMPTRGEAFGIVFQEAAAAGLPVVATRINAVPEIVRDGVDGVLVDPGDVDALAAALGSLVTDPERRLAMGLSARRRVEDDSVERYGQRLAALVREVAGRGTR